MTSIFNRTVTVDLTLQRIECRNPPIAYLRAQRIILLNGLWLWKGIPDIVLDELQMHAEVHIQGWVKELFEDFIKDPSGDAGSSNDGHLSAPLQLGPQVYNTPKPRRDALPRLPYLEGDVLDGAVEPLKTRNVLIIIKRCARLREALVSKGILQTFDLGFTIEIEVFDFAVLAHYICRHGLLASRQ